MKTLESLTSHVIKVIKQSPWTINAFFLLFLLIISLSIKSCYSTQSGKKNHLSTPFSTRNGEEITVPADSALRNHLIIKPVESVALRHMLDIPGVVEVNPKLVKYIFPPLNGRILSLPVQLNDFVTLNQPLSLIASAGLATVTADYLKAQSELELAERSLTRARAVNQVGGNAIKEVQALENEYHVAKAEYERTQISLNSLGENPANQLTLTAPIAGQISGIFASEGAFITDPTRPIITITNLESVFITANVPEIDAARIKPGQHVIITLPSHPNTVIKTTIHSIDAWFDAETRRNKTRIVFDNRLLKLQPNLYAAVHIMLREPPEILIPLSAVLMSNDTTSVYVETRPWHFKRRPVILGEEDGKRVRVLSGLTSNTRIVHAGGIFIND